MGKEDINRVPRALTNSLNSKLMDQLYDLIPGTNVVVDLIVYLSRHQIISARSRTTVETRGR